MTRPLTAMGGLLARASDGWRWSDGTLETRVRDLTALEAFQFARVTYPDAQGTRVQWLSIPVQALDEEPDIQEMVRAVGAAARNSEHDAGRIEVPVVLWEAWARDRVIGVVWDAEDEVSLMADARARRSRAR